MKKLSETMGIDLLSLMRHTPDPLSGEEPLSDDVIRRSLKELADIKFALDQSAIVAITDTQGIITYVNEALCRISGYAPEELVGKTHKIINSGTHPREFFNDMWATIAQGKVWKGEIRNRKKNGQHYWVDTTIVPFLDEQGKPYQYIAIRHEITDRKRVEEEIRQLNRELEQRVQERTQALEDTNRELSEALRKLQASERVRNTFVSALTHDLRTPLVAQKRALELMQNFKASLPEKLVTLTEMLLSSNDNLLNMVNQLLESYQYESGKVHLLLEPVDFNAIAADCVSELAPMAEQKQIRLSNSLPEGLPVVNGDASQLRRVLINLLGNALANIPAGSTITLGGQADDTHIQVSVCDDGPGIAPELLPQLFERYFLWERTQKKIGTGLGLYICRMIMELHHGAIRVESEPGKGTCFTLSIPRS